MGITAFFMSSFISGQQIMKCLPQIKGVSDQARDQEKDPEKEWNEPDTSSTQEWYVLSYFPT